MVAYAKKTWTAGRTRALADLNESDFSAIVEAAQAIGLVKNERAGPADGYRLDTVNTPGAGDSTLRITHTEAGHFVLVTGKPEAFNGGLPLIGPVNRSGSGGSSTDLQVDIPSGWGSIDIANEIGLAGLGYNATYLGASNGLWTEQNFGGGTWNAVALVENYAVFLEGLADEVLGGVVDPQLYDVLNVAAGREVFATYASRQELAADGIDYLYVDPDFTGVAGNGINITLEAPTEADEATRVISGSGTNTLVMRIGATGGVRHTILEVVNALAGTQHATGGLYFAYNTGTQPCPAFAAGNFAGGADGEYAGFAVARDSLANAGIGASGATTFSDQWAEASSADIGSYSEAALSNALAAELAWADGAKAAYGSIIHSTVPSVVLAAVREPSTAAMVFEASRRAYATCGGIDVPTAVTDLGNFSITYGNDIGP